ncbi:MAG: VWA domain-containing protein, partial [Clostridiales bacterium]|nr:VWA domain-containing protein [Clostridiales bacterium]
MGFNAVNAFWLLPFLGLIVLMYLLKEEHEEKEISSLYLWKTAMANSEVKKPWQKLKNNILMILQLLAAFLIIITLAKPYVKTQKALSGNIIIVIDNSGSMNALLKDKSRLETAKNMAENIVKEAEHNSFFTVISSAGDAKIEISNIKDKAEIIDTIKAIKKSDMQGNLEKQKSIIKAIYNQYQ